MTKQQAKQLVDMGEKKQTTRKPFLTRYASKPQLGQNMNSQRSQKRKSSVNPMQRYKTMQPNGEENERNQRTPLGKAHKRQQRRTASKAHSSLNKLAENEVVQSFHGSMKKLDKLKPPLLKQNYTHSKLPSREIS